MRPRTPPWGPEAGDDVLDGTRWARLTGLEAVERYGARDAARRPRAESDKHFGSVTRPSRAVLTEVATFPGY